MKKMYKLTIRMIYVEYISLCNWWNYQKIISKDIKDLINPVNTLGLIDVFIAPKPQNAEYPYKLEYVLKPHEIQQEISIEKTL